MDDAGAMPDFGGGLDAGGVQAFAASPAGPFTVMPQGARLAASGGRPLFGLSLVNQPDCPGAAGNYAVLDITIDLDTPLDEALAAARALHAEATVVPATIERGFACLAPDGAVDLPAALLTPVPLGMSSGGARWTHRMDAEAGAMLKNALLQGTLLLRAQVAFTVRGVAARVPGTASFVPATLIPALLGSAGALAAPQLVARLADPSLPLETTGSDRGLLAQTLADRILAAFGALVPAAAPADPPSISFPGPLPIERLDWDLRAPAAGLRAFAVTLDPLAPVRAMADPSGLVREISIPPLDLGFRDIVAAANLPPNRAGMPAIGVHISLPPMPPDRPSGIDETAVFAPSDDTARLTLRLGPQETLAYTATPFVILAAGSTVQQLKAPGLARQGPFLALRPADFPVVFAHITASDRLLAQATITGALNYAHGGAQAVQPVTLRPGAAEISVAAPAGAADAIITLSARAADGTVLTLPPRPPGPIRLDLPSFPGFGPHRIAVSAAMPPDASPLMLEFQSEDGATQGAAMLTSASPDAVWGYVAASPFRAGFRFRAQAGGAWSGTLPPCATLCLETDGTMSQSNTPQDPFTIDGITLAPSADGATAYYTPAAPTPECDAGGKPTLSIYRTPQSAILQLGAQFGLSAEALAALAVKLAAHSPSLAGARLQPAPMQVQKAAVLLADETGAASEVAASPASGFPPYGAVFNTTLSPAQAAQAISAAGGRRGVLFVDYTIVAQDAVPSVRRTDVAGWFAGTDGLSHVHAVG